jgi:hypothetical protein
MINKGKQAIAPVTQPFQKAFTPAYETAKSAISPITNTVSSVIQPIIKNAVFQKKTQDYYAPFKSEIEKIGITYDDLAELPEEEKQQVVSQLQQIGVSIPGYVQPQQVEQPTDFSNRGLSIDPNYKPVNFLWELTADIPKFQSQPDEWFAMSTAKTIGNLPSNALQVAGGVGDIGLSYLRNIWEWPIDSFTETAKAKIINPTYQQALGVADIASKWYSAWEKWKLRMVEGGKELNAPSWVKWTAWAMDALLKKGTEFVVENPVSTIGMIQWVKNIPRGTQALKTAGSEAMKWNIGTSTKWLIKSTGVGLKENIYDPIKMGVTAPFILWKAGAKVIGKWISKWLEKSGVRSPLSSNNVTARTEAGTEFTVDQTPTLGKNITDKLFNKDNEILAQQSVFPKATKEKTPQARLDSAKIALQWVKQLYEDKANWVVKSDINNMGGGVEGIQEWLDYHGSQIGKLTKNDSIVDTADLTPKLDEVIAKPFASLNPDMHSLVTKVADAFNQSGNKVNIETLQWALSNIKSEIFGNWANIAKLYKTESGKALNDFLKNLEERFQKTIEETSGNSAELAKSKKAYSNYKKIEKDLTDSYMVELRNQWKWLTGTAWKVAGLYEVLSNPSISGILKAVALKQAGETMQYYKSRGGNWETLIRNLDRESVQRATTNPTKNDWTNKPMSSNMDNSKLWVKPIVKPNTIKNESKLIKPNTGNTIPEGYTKNTFWEIIKKPSNKKGGFIKIWSESKKISTPSDIRKVLEKEWIKTYKKDSSVSWSAIRNISESWDIKISKAMEKNRKWEIVTDKYNDRKWVIKVEKYINIDDRTKKLDNIMKVLDKNWIKYRKLWFDMFTTANEWQTVSWIEFNL